MLTLQQIDSFHANGYLIMRGVFGGEELRRFTDAVDAVQADGVARRGEHHLYAPGPGGDDVYWRSEWMWNRGDIFKAVTVNPALLENIGQCIGQAFYPWNDSLVVKLAGQGAAVRWHQDPPYCDAARGTTFPIPNFTADLYLDASTTENGCVYAIPGHHLVGHVDLDSRTEDELFSVSTPLEMEAGDVLFHALSAPHGSRANTAHGQRRIFYVHYLCDDAYQDAYARTGEEWVRHKPGWGEERRDLVRSMIDARRRHGWTDYSATGTLSFGEGGFLFTGSPASDRACWGPLAAAMSADAVSRRKSLKTD